MKKIALFLVVLMLSSLCACRSNNETNNTPTNSTPSNSNSNTTSIKDDFTLPERADPTSSTNSTSSNNSSFNPYHEDEIVESELKVTEKITIEVEKTSYTSSAKMINIVLQSDSVFNYYTDFFLQKYENGKWEYHITKNENIEYRFNVATSESKIHFFTYNISQLYNTPLPTGTYRIIQESDVGKIVSNSFEIIDNIVSNEEQ